MLKIKIKNIPLSTQRRVCLADAKCFDCPFREEVGEDWICIFDDDSDDNVGNKVIDMDEKDFPTNREWMEGLSDEDLAAFYTHGLIIEKYSPFPINIHQIIGNFMSSQSGIKEWLSEPCKFLMEISTDAENQS